MSNSDRAAYIIAGYGQNCERCKDEKDICEVCAWRARFAVDELDNAGLLAPDMKETPMSDFPRGYQMWSDYQDEAPDDLANRLRAELIDAIDRLTTTLKENK